jgi:hypothetical protein
MDTPRPQRFGMLAGLFLAAGLVASALLLARTWLRISESQTITVTGSARRAVASDLVHWRGSWSSEASTLLEAQRALKADGGKVESFLRGQGLTNYSFSPIAIHEVRAPVRNSGEGGSGAVVAYRLSRSVDIRSTEVERLAGLDQETSALVEAGVAFATDSPRFIYTKAGEAKVEMLGEATRDARLRADQIASQGGRAVKSLRQARMGVFQITPLHSLETSWEGINDTTSIQKTITAVVTVVFSLR